MSNPHDPAAIDTVPVLAQQPLDPNDARKTFAREFGLPEDSDAHAIISHVIKEVGHQITLLYLIQLATMMDADIQVYVTERESETSTIPV